MSDTDTPTRRGPGRPRKVPTTHEVAREKVAEAAPYLSMSPEATAAHVAHGDARKIAVPDAVFEADELDDVSVDRKDMVFHEDATHVGFDDGSMYEVKNGKITKQVRKAD